MSMDNPESDPQLGSSESEPASDTSRAPGSDPEQGDGALAEARAEVARLKDQLLRTAADFDNYRKRTRREIDDAQKRGREDLFREILPVFDNLERAVAHAGQASDAKSVAEGVNMVLKQFADSLGRIGVRRIATVGQPFDPAQHEAIQQIESKEQPAGTVVAEVQPGYAMGDRLVRAAMVVVAKAPAGADSPPKHQSN